MRINIIPIRELVLFQLFQFVNLCYSNYSNSFPYSKHESHKLIFLMIT